MVTTVDGGTASQDRTPSLINYLPLPTITSLNQTSSYKNRTVAFTLTGNNFQPGGTYVRLYLNATVTPVNAVLSSVTSTKILGTFTIPSDQSSGKYRS